MGVKVKTKINKFPHMEKSLESLNGKKVLVGVLGGGEQSWLAGIHEYGCNIEVTPKMRAWLHRNGLHLKKDTKEIHIPERSFLRSGYDEHKDEVLKKVDEIVGLVSDGSMSAEDFLETIGLLLSSKIKDFAVDLKIPAKHPFTLECNGGKKTNPLVDSGDMINAITYRVE